MGKTIGIVSLKGGVGKTTSTASLGSALANLGKKVLLVDANFTAPNLGLHFDIIDPETTLHHVMTKKANIADAIQTVGNLDILPCSIFGRFNISPLRLKSHLSSLKRKYDYILIDSSPSLNDETLAAMFASDEILVVSTPDIPTLSMSMKAIKLAKQRGTPISGMILTKVYGKDFEIPLKDIQKTAEVPIMAVIPHDIKVPEALSAASSYVNHKPKRKGSREYIKLAQTLSGIKQKKGIRRFLKFKVSPQEVNREVFYSKAF